MFAWLGLDPRKLLGVWRGRGGDAGAIEAAPDAVGLDDEPGGHGQTKVYARRPARAGDGWS